MKSGWGRCHGAGGLARNPTVELEGCPEHHAVLSFADSPEAPAHTLLLIQGVPSLQYLAFSLLSSLFSAF